MGGASTGTIQVGLRCAVDELEECAITVAMHVIARGQQTGIEGRGARAARANALDALAMNVLRRLAFMLGIVPAIGNGFPATDPALMACHDGEVVVDGHRRCIDAHDDDLSYEGVRHGVEVGAHLHVTVRAHAMFAPRADR